MAALRKFMIVVDETPECQNALRFAARRAANTGVGPLRPTAAPSTTMASDGAARSW